MLTPHVLRHPSLEMPHAYKYDPCPWTGLEILLADPTLLDPRFLLVLSAVHNNEVPSRCWTLLLETGCSPKHNRKCCNILQDGMDVAFSFPKLLGIPRDLLDLFLQDEGTESSNSNILPKLLDNNICLQ